MESCIVRASRFFATACIAALVCACVAFQSERAYAAPDNLHTVESLDQQIENIGSAQEWSQIMASDAPSRDLELLILQRNLVAEVGYDVLAAYADESEGKSAFLSWLLSDVDALRYYVTGGEPYVKSGKASSAQHIGALDILRCLRDAHPSDLEGDDADVHLRMMVSAALAQSNRSRLWTGDPGFVSDPLVRYETIKVFRDNAEHYRFQKDLFDRLPVENMRWVFENQITDAELAWLANYTLGKVPDVEKEKDRLNAYSYIWYGGVNNSWATEGTYSYKGFYDPAQFSGPVTEIKPSGEGGSYREWQGGWKEKYRLDYTDEHFPNKSEDDAFYIGCAQTSDAEGATQDPMKYHRLWMVFEKGGVCGALAKTFSNLNCMVGAPSAVMGQPGHAAAMTYELRTNEAGEQQGAYRLQNDVSGWSNSDVPSAAHYLNNWVQQRKVANGEYIRGGTYTVYAQAALNDFDAYVKSFELRLLADSFASPDEKQALIDAALTAQGFNYDAITAKIALYEQKGASEQEWMELVQFIADQLAFYPLPLHDFLKVIDQRTQGAYVVALEDLRIRTLQKATQATAADVFQPEVAKAMANALLGKSDGYLAAFSFDGKDANTLKLGAQFASGGTPWEYSLDGGKTWVQLLNGQTKVTLNEEEMASITPENDILVRFVGLSTVNAIDITKAESALPAYFLNDRSNALYFNDAKMLSKIEARVAQGEWTPLSQKNAFAGDVDVQLRFAASGTALPSDPVTVSFTKSNEPDMAFVPYGELNVNSYSTSQNGVDGAKRVLDGNALSYWHNAWSGNDLDGWIVIDLGHERDIAAFDFWPRGDHGNGTPRNRMSVFAANDAGAEPGVAVSADAFEQVKEVSGFSWKKGAPTRVTFDEPVRARYIKLQTHGDKFFSCALLDFFETTVSRPVLNASAVDLGCVEYGYEPKAATLALANEGAAQAFVDSVKVDSDAFVVEQGDAQIAPESENASWKISAKKGLASGVYEGEATVLYHADGEQPGSRMATASVVFEVTKKESHTLTLKVQFTGDTSVRLSAETDASDAAVQYALCTADAHPADDEASVLAASAFDVWTDEAEFSGLDPYVEYFAFARIVGDDNHGGAVTTSSLSVVLPHAPGPDGNGSGGGLAPDGGDQSEPNGDGNASGGGSDGESEGSDGGEGTEDGESGTEGGGSADPDSGQNDGDVQAGQGGEEKPDDGGSWSGGVSAGESDVHSPNGQASFEDVREKNEHLEKTVAAMSDGTAALVVTFCMTALASLTVATVAMRMRASRIREER
ncbi:MAG: discoidin domain-containing protein [Slackia sp.]|nr:discoidin domain-containing protein [Slackia sp.]